MSSHSRVVYFFDDSIGDIIYDTNHPMKPHRVRMTHTLLLAYDLIKSMKVLRPKRASALEMTRFHSTEYIQILMEISPSNIHNQKLPLEKYGFTDDSPIFDNLFEFCQISAGGTISSAEMLCKQQADIAINWAGGLHHAKREMASGFCYVADCVLGILQLLERYSRILYVDIDIHHGDGVEEAFFTTDRVLTVSFHKEGFFPYSGNIKDIGFGRGKYYAVNVPLRDGIDDEGYLSLFKPIVQHCLEWYKPEAIFLQCGADSLAGDQLGLFNLTIDGHAECVRFVKSFGLPLIVSGGGGYTVRNVARCWAYETAVILDQTVPRELPYNEYISYFGPEYTLEMKPSVSENLNSPSYLNGLKTEIIENLRHLPCAPAIPPLGTFDINNFLAQSSSSDNEDIFDNQIISKYLSTPIDISSF